MRRLQGCTKVYERGVPLSRCEATTWLIWLIGDLCLSTFLLDLGEPQQADIFRGMPYGCRGGAGAGSMLLSGWMSWFGLQFWNYTFLSSTWDRAPSVARLYEGVGTNGACRCLGARQPRD